MNVTPHARRKPPSGSQVSQPLQSLKRHEFSVCLLLELLGERLTRFERSLSAEKADCDFGAYTESMTLLDAIYLFSRMLLDSAAGVVRHVHKCNTGHELPKSFHKLLEKSVHGKLPNNLNAVFSSCETWFPQLKDRRDKIVHHFETPFIVLSRNSEGGRTAMQFSPREKTQPTGNEDLRSYIGTMMAGYQAFVDRLLDHWDEVFRDVHGISVFRHRITFEGQAGNILWWACRHGGYTNDSLVVIES